MHRFAFLAAIAVVGLSCGCTATPPKSQQVSSDPVLSRQGGVLLLVDVCVQRDQVGNDDYFLIDESASGGQAALEALHKYLAPSDLHVRSQVTAVCAARLNADGSLISVADNVDAEKRQAPQPLRISGSHTEDPQYVRALGVISTYAFERAAVDKKDADEAEPAASIDMSEFRAAAGVIQERARVSSVLFLGALGTSRSAAKRVAQKVFSTTVGVFTGVATAGLGTGYALIFMPGYQTDGVVMEGALVDLQSGELTWSNAVRTGGDPVHPEVIANRPILELLFRDVMFKPLAGPSAVSSNE
ncbi:MAG TPA: hypothetical protein VGD45_21110 [Steroidobacter sp.]|uniref:hypothetical protein n=1 Tax=Steroidobacter sp. TaxID=1978227 RepID=UPI002ED9BB45